MTGLTLVVVVVEAEAEVVGHQQLVGSNAPIGAYESCPRIFVLVRKTLIAIKSYLLPCLKIQPLARLSRSLFLGPSAGPIILEVLQKDRHGQRACLQGVIVTLHSLLEKLPLVGIVVKDKAGLEQKRCHRGICRQIRYVYLKDKCDSHALEGSEYVQAVLEAV